MSPRSRSSAADTTPDRSAEVGADVDEARHGRHARDRADRRRENATIERTLALVGDRWTILVLRASFRGISRFDDFCADLGIARPILTERLKRLVGAGLLTKEPYQAHPPRFDYKLTPAGVALSPAIVALVRWGDQHLADGPPLTRLVHAPCGAELEQGFWCETCATTFGPGAIRGVPATDVGAAG